MKKRLPLFLCFFSLFFTFSCITVPPEVIVLSKQTNDDVQKLHEGYRSLVRRHFVALRKIRETEFADKVVRPYIEDAIKEGRLIDVIQGKVVWNNEKEVFEPPSPTTATFQKLDTLNTWNRQVAEDIEDLRKNAFKDLGDKETEILQSVDQAFGNVTKGGSIVYGYLLSIKKLEDAQKEILKEANLEDLPKKINDSLDQASQEASKWNAKADDTQKKVKTLKDRISKIKGGKNG